MGRNITAHLVILQVFVLGIIAWISSAGALEHDRISAGTLRLDARNASQIELRGLLKCTLPESNAGTPCILELVEHESGKTLRVAGSNTAMRLFQSGQTQVVATGAILGDVLRILEIRAE